MASKLSRIWMFRGVRANGLMEGRIIPVDPARLPCYRGTIVTASERREDRGDAAVQAQGNGPAAPPRRREGADRSPAREEDPQGAEGAGGIPRHLPGRSPRG